MVKYDSTLITFGPVVTSILHFFFFDEVERDRSIYTLRFT